MSVTRSVSVPPPPSIDQAGSLKSTVPSPLTLPKARRCSEVLAVEPRLGQGVGPEVIKLVGTISYEETDGQAYMRVWLFVRAA